MAVGNLVKRLQDIMRKDAGINGEECNEAVRELENELYKEA